MRLIWKKKKHIKKLSHNIGKIVENLTENSQDIFNEKLTIDYENYKVFHRYIFESEMAFREEIGILGIKYYETINNYSWRQSFYKEIENFIEFVESKNPFEIKIQSFSEINIEDEISEFNKLKEILT